MEAFNQVNNGKGKQPDFKSKCKERVNEYYMLEKKLNSENWAFIKGEKGLAGYYKTWKNTCGAKTDILYKDLVTFSETTAKLFKKRAIDEEMKKETHSCKTWGDKIKYAEDHRYPRNKKIVYDYPEAASCNQDKCKLDQQETINLIKSGFNDAHIMLWQRAYFDHNWAMDTYNKIAAGTQNGDTFDDQCEARGKKFGQKVEELLEITIKSIDVKTNEIFEDRCPTLKCGDVATK